MDAMEKNCFETELPAGYTEVYAVDAKNKKTGVLLNLASVPIMLLVAAPLIRLIRPTDFFGNYSIARMLWACGCLLAYLVLHELVHGAAYKLLTRRKLTFGITLSAAYCGVPDIYVYRRAALISLLAPFTVFILVFGALTLLLPNPWDKTYMAAVLAIHVGACSGDLYDTALYLFRFRDPRTLMRDTGPRQTFYLPGDLLVTDH